MMLFVQVDVSKLNPSSHSAFLNDLVKACQKSKIDGIVLRQTKFDEEAKQALNTLKGAITDPDSLIIVSEGRKITSSEDVLERLKEGATLTTTCDPFYL